MSAERDRVEGVLRDAAHAAFMAFWREADTPAAVPHHVELRTVGWTSCRLGELVELHSWIVGSGGRRQT